MEFKSYLIKDGEKLKKGYTTGSTAAAAAKAAVKSLLNQKEVKKVEIDTPAGVKLNLEVADIELKSGAKREIARASVIKDAGDDPDVTDGLKIFAKVELSDRAEIEVLGGKGVGKVTKPGLAVEVGKAAINPVPHKMIKKEIKKLVPEGKGAKVIIEVPKGEELAQETLNPQLGIVGGISILGTTGIVEPMSKRAYRDSLVLAIDQALAVGEEELVFVFGNYGKNTAIELGFKKEQIVRMSNFVGFMLKKAVEKGVKKIILIGHIGKLVKVAAGIFNTHSQVADARRETIAAYTAFLGGSQSLIKNILAANTAEETVALIKESQLDKVFNLLAKRAAKRAEEHVKKELKIKGIIFSMQKGVLGSYDG